MRQLPQRLARPAAPGELLKRPAIVTRPTKQTRGRESDPAYLAMIRQLPCLRCGMEPCGEAAHVRSQSGAHGKKSGMQRTPADKWALPLDGMCHREDSDALHRVGELTFFHLLGISPVPLCVKLYAARGDVVRMRAIVIQAMAERQQPKPEQ